MVNQRRRMLMYMRRQDFPAYCYTLRKLGLRDIYTETVRGVPDQKTFKGRVFSVLSINNVGL